jgi:hypothetical protein
MPPGPFVCLVVRELGCRLTELRAGRYGKRSRRGTSSVGRALASQAKGRGFETRVPLSKHLVSGCLVEQISPGAIPGRPLRSAGSQPSSSPIPRSTEC